MGLSHKNFYGGRRVFVNNMWRAGMRMALRILLIFKKNFFAKKTLSSRYGGKARRYFLRKAYNFFFKKFLLLKANCIAVAVNIKLSE